jgi:hypothetical protein
VSGALVRRAKVALLLLLVLLLFATPSRAQSAGGRFDLGAGFRFAGSIALATVNATETSFGGTPRTVFVSNTSLQSSAGGLLWFTARLTTFLDAEGAVTVSAPGLATAISNDIEGAPDTTAREDLRQYSFEGGVAVHPPSWRRLSWAPFVSAGAGQLRQLHEGHVLVETGSLFYAGAGVRYTMRARANALQPGVRADLRAAFMKDGVAFDRALHGAPQFSLSAFVRF